MKALIVVLAIGAIVFRFAKPIALTFSAERDFSRRRNLWFVLTVTAFLSPSFWLYAAVAIPLFAWAGRKDSNPVALYLFLLHVIPPIPVDIPIVGINALFPLDNYRLLSFCVLIPTAVGLRQSNDAFRIRGLTTMDALLLCYGAVQIAFFIPPDLPNHVILPDSFTNALRRAFLFYIDVYVLYFVVSRSCTSRRAIVEAQAAFCMSSLVMASVAFFESARHWLLYVDIAARWTDDPSFGFYLMRGNTLRAQTTAGHALALGFLLAIAFGFWLYLQNQIKARGTRIVVSLLLWLGLLATYSRGPWIGALVIYLSFSALRPRAFSRLFKAATVAVSVGGVLALSPLGDRVISVLPFMGGTVDSGSLPYRQRLTHRAWELIQASPIFGDHRPWDKMENLRQGQGIIDLVNTYAQVALYYGLCGLSLFIGFILVGLCKTYLFARTLMLSDPDLALLGICITACILGTLLMIASNSFGLGVEKMYYVLAGLAAAYAHLRTSRETR
jgi:O-antigen ligase/polysaccharide polymerase Wzy-like membrane protein